MKQPTMNPKEAPTKLTENEGCVLELVKRFQPTTAYNIIKNFRASPIANFNSSAGHIYPMFKRFAKAKLVAGQKVVGDSRGTEEWCITDQGTAALRDWVYDVRPNMLITHDSLRAKVFSFGILTHQERIDWVIMAKAKLKEQMKQATIWRETVRVPFGKWAHDNAASTIKARMEWLDRVLFDLITEGPEAGERD